MATAKPSDLSFDPLGLETNPPYPNIECEWIKAHPIAHRGLHDASAKVYENSTSAFRLAIEAGYAIETDLQWTKDKKVVVFHDLTLNRMTPAEGIIRQTHSSIATKLTLGESSDTIPTLKDLLQLVDGKVGLVLEIKSNKETDQGFVEAITKDLAGYKGNVAIMSFKHHILADGRKVAPHLPLGLTAEGDDSKYKRHADITKAINADFLSYDVDELPNAFVNDFRKTGRPVTSWTVNTQQRMDIASKYSDQPTFEGIEPTISK